jgi:hypothetical protein
MGQSECGGGYGGGTIGLGQIGTLGHGSGEGSGYGYGTGRGSLGGHRATGPTCTVGATQVRGSLDKEVIRRVIRAHLNELRFCYERALQSHPDLAPRVPVEFVISADGSVATVRAEAPAGDHGVARCVASAFQRFRFPHVPGGGATAVRYPLQFVVAGD